MSQVALVIIYNHRFDRNIPILEDIYKDRFSHIYHLIPFYDGDQPNVIPVYENSFYFQGYVAQGLKCYFREEYEHYFFVADDMILNPVVNERNYKEHLRLEAHTSFLPGFVQFHQITSWWQRATEAFHYRVEMQGVEAKNELPSYEAALEAFKRHGLENMPLSWDQINTPQQRPPLTQPKRMMYYSYAKLKRSLNLNTRYNLSYPLVGSYSDIFVISGQTIRRFCHFCGVFAATNLFVEVGLPTALVLASDAIVTEKELKLQGRPLWTEEDYKVLDKYDKQLKRLLNEFPPDYLYLHAIKLSKWNCAL